MSLAEFLRLCEAVPAWVVEDRPHSSFCEECVDQAALFFEPKLSEESEPLNYPLRCNDCDAFLVCRLTEEALAIDWLSA